ncbi:hypothetical protein K461DRAFT_97258 [Myriangium duriaei CBS 260.36]|uniref:Uncharacterized protein n=1 Tax=Myriangium duriaei CBS 260.36 TaxID=1168546 RepID=A0A9P4J7Y1_9PEZI|nr:hypothetical protein K461DRAFT_97258 [Myriangium duriaei CBS 260.36]
MGAHPCCEGRGTQMACSFSMLTPFQKSSAARQPILQPPPTRLRGYNHSISPSALPRHAMRNPIWVRLYPANLESDGPSAAKLNIGFSQEQTFRPASGCCTAHAPILNPTLNPLGRGRPILLVLGTLHLATTAIHDEAFQQYDEPKRKNKSWP